MSADIAQAIRTMQTGMRSLEAEAARRHRPSRTRSKSVNTHCTLRAERATPCGDQGNKPSGERYSGTPTTARSNVAEADRGCPSVALSPPHSPVRPPAPALGADVRSASACCAPSPQHSRAARNR